MTEKISLKKVRFQYRGFPNWVLKGVNLSVEEGELYVLEGPSGAGKTTLCLCLNGLIPNSLKGTFEGNVEVAGYNTSQVPVSKMAEKVGITFQDPESQFICMDVEAEIAFGLECLNLSDNEIKERIEFALDAVGIDRSYLKRVPQSLSGGEKQRVAIATELAVRPEVLIMDEPTSELDPVGKAMIFSIVKDLKKEGVTIFMVEHEPEMIAESADRVGLLYDGELVLEGSPEEFYKKVDKLNYYGVRSPQVSELGYLLRKAGFPNQIPLTLEQAHEMVNDLLRGDGGGKH